MNNENLTTEIRMYIKEKLDSFYRVYEEENINENNLKIVTALIEHFESMASFVGGINFKQRQEDRQLGNIKPKNIEYGIKL